MNLGFPARVRPARNALTVELNCANCARKHAARAQSPKTSAERTAQNVPKRVAAACFEKHASDLEDLMSVLSANEKQQLYASLKKLGLLTAQKLRGSRQSVQK
jgi:hypothetical protein